MTTALETKGEVNISYVQSNITYIFKAGKKIKWARALKMAQERAKISSPIRSKGALMHPPTLW